MRSSGFARTTVTVMVTVAPASAGLGTTDAETICGTEVSSVTFRVTVDSLPAASVAVTTMVFAPSESVTDLENAPFACTVTSP